MINTDLKDDIKSIEQRKVVLSLLQPMVIFLIPLFNRVLHFEKDSF
jgi:hypothetical protein